MQPLSTVVFICTAFGAVRFQSPVVIDFFGDGDRSRMVLGVCGLHTGSSHHVITMVWDRTADPFWQPQLLSSPV